MLKILLLVGLPLAWGVLVDMVFERLRHRLTRAGRRARRDESPHDWVI